MHLYILTLDDLDDLYACYMDYVSANTTTSCALLGVA